MRPLCLLGNTTSHINRDYVLGYSQLPSNESYRDNACGGGRSVGWSVSQSALQLIPYCTIQLKGRTKEGRALIRVAIGLETAFTKEGQSQSHFHCQVTWSSDIEKLVDCFP